MFSSKPLESKQLPPPHSHPKKEQKTNKETEKKNTPRLVYSVSRKTQYFNSCYFHHVNVHISVFQFFVFRWKWSIFQLRTGRIYWLLAMCIYNLISKWLLINHCPKKKEGINLRVLQQYTFTSVKANLDDRRPTCNIHTFHCKRVQIERYQNNVECKRITPLEWSEYTEARN